MDQTKISRPLGSHQHLMEGKVVEARLHIENRLVPSFKNQGSQELGFPFSDKWNSLEGCLYTWEDGFEVGTNPNEQSLSQW